MQVFFDLVNGTDLIRDEEGREASHLEEAHSQALAAVRESLADDPACFEGWRLGRGLNCSQPQPC